MEKKALVHCDPSDGESEISECKAKSGIALKNSLSSLAQQSHRKLIGFE